MPGNLLLIPTLSVTHKFYKKIGEEERSQLVIAKIAECFFTIQDIESFSLHVKNTVKRDKVNIRLASICAYASEQLGIENDYPFCTNPLIKLP